MNAIHTPKIIKPIKTDFERLNDLLENRAKITGGQSMTEFAETCLVTNGPKKGDLIKLADANYSRRPLELMDPGHHCQLCILMWASQSMKSITAQITTTYFTKVVPSEILYAMTDLEVMRKTMNRRLTPMIEHQGVEFITQSTTKASRKTGDTTYQKEFPGGNLDGVTSNSSAALASETKRLFVPDELGNWKTEIGNQGNPYYQGWARLKAWGEEKKCLVPSTPGDESACMVELLFLTGTCEEWFVPCPRCGEYQTLEVQNRDGYGLDWRVKRGKIIEPSIVYVCKHCAKSFTEKRKYEIQQSGKWIRPDDIEPINRYTYSFHLHSINSMFERWFEIASASERAKDDPIAKKYYDNHVAGSPHKQAGSKISSELVQKNRGDYKRQTIPDGVVILTLGGDVQRGADRWQEFTEEELQIEIAKAKKEGDIHDKKFPRIEIEVFGSGPAYRGWSIDYQVFYGHVDNAYTGAFELLYEWAIATAEKNGGFGFKREKDGRLFLVDLLLIDSGYNAPIVYDFTQRIDITFPIKDERTITPSKNQKNNELHPLNFQRWKKSVVGSGITLYIVSQKLYMNSLYKFLTVQRTNDDVQPANFQDFPRDYDSRYFDMLTADELLVTGEYDNKGRPNEARACRVYAMCAADIVIDQQVRAWREFYKKEKKWTEQQIEGINSRWVIEYLAKKKEIDKRFLITKSDSYKKKSK